MKNFIKNFETSLTASGYIGDTRPPKLAYLSLVSALFDEPVSTLIKGSSGSGKSFALKAAKRYVPEGAYVEFSGMSEKALLYLPDDISLKNKTLIIQEAAGYNSGVGRAFLRQLLTENEIKYATVNSTAQSGLKGEVLKSVEGPCALIMTTTANALHHEDENRMLAITVQPSASDMKAAMMSNLRGHLSEPTEEELAPWHEAFNQAKADTESGVKVVVPYAERIIELLKVNHTRLMRDMPKVITLVKTLALLQADQRGRDSDGNIVATLDDYAQVREIVEEALSHGLEVAVPDGVRLVVEAVEVLEKKSTCPPEGTHYPFDPGAHHGRITQAVIAEHLKLDRGTVSRNLKSAIKGEYLVDENPGQGKVSDVRTGRVKMPNGHVLPEAEALDQPSSEQDRPDALEQALEEVHPDVYQVKAR